MCFIFAEKAFKLKKLKICTNFLNIGKDSFGYRLNINKGDIESTQPPSSISRY